MKRGELYRVAHPSSDDKIQMLNQALKMALDIPEDFPEFLHGK